MRQSAARLWAVARRSAGRLINDRWWRITAVAAFAGLALRLYVVLIARPSCSPDPAETGCFRINGDVLYHFTQGRLIGDGHFFKSGIEYDASGRLMESAGDPPLFALMLGLWSALGFDTLTWQRFLVSFVGATTVVLVAVLARRLGGDRAGWIAGALAAAHPLLWINDAMLMSEALYQPAVTVVMLAAVAYTARPMRAKAATVGAALAVAALVRAEAAVLVVVLLVPLCMLARSLLVGERCRHLMIGGASALLVVAPWITYNNLRFEDPVTLTAGSGAVLMAGSCDTAWSGPRMGSWWDCFSERDLWDEYETEFPGVMDTPPEARTIYDESLIDSFNRRYAFDYIGDNVSRLPAVMLARVGRALSVFRVGNTLENDTGLEGRWTRPSQVGLVLYYLLLIPASVGAYRMRGAGQRLTPMLSWWPMVMVTAALTFSLTRYRVPVDIAMIVLAAVAGGTAYQRRDLANADTGAAVTSDSMPAATAVTAQSPQQAAVEDACEVRKPWTLPPWTLPP